MATKWNGFRYKPLTKALAFVLGLLMAAGCVFLCAQMLQGKSGFQEDIFAREFTDTREFKVYVNNIIDYATWMTRRFISEEAVKDGSAFEVEKKQILSALEKDIVARTNECKDTLRHNPDDYYNYRDNSWYTTEDGRFAVDEAAIRAELTEQTQQFILDMQTQFRQDYNRAKQTLSRAHSLRYAVVDRASGRVSTNMEGEEYRAAVEAMPWAAWTENAYRSGATVKSGGTTSPSADLWFSNQVDFFVGFDQAAVLISGTPDTLAQKALDFQAFAKTRVAKLSAIALLFLLCCLDGVYLICVAGRLEKGGAIHLCGTDRIWNFLHWIVGFGGGSLLLLLEIAAIDGNNLYNNVSDTLLSVICGLAAILPLALMGETVLSIARHAKNRTVLKNTLWHRLGGIRPRSIKRNTLLVLLGFLVWNVFTSFVLLFMIDGGSDGAVILFAMLVLPLVSVVAAYFLLLKHLSALDEIRRAVTQTKQGNLASPLTPGNMPAGMKSLAEGILEMRQGMDAAVRQAVAGERMKTELITNVSHDLKTPLTSVINYVDLLRREDITEEERGEYLLTLAQKSEQLRRLVDDLVEASKASSGNVELSPVEVNLHELALQAMGETSDALAAQGIEIIIQAPEEPPVVWADSQKTWRVIENLMSNVTKYTMPGTRVYLQLERENGFGGLIVKNISREALNIAAEELAQRFVRGDKARTGDGSGLGLSIAESLCKVQGGRFELGVDGDLFKAAVWLPLKNIP